jgi:aminopeptidase N
MEYAGVVTIGEDLYGAYREQLGYLVTHEVAHQWWYAQVGSDPLAAPWLDEGLAEYAAYDYYRGVYGQGAAEALLRSRWQMPVDAALFFDAVRQQLGDEAYQAALREYVDTHRWRVAQPDDLLSALQRTPDQDLTSLVDVWLR